MPGKTNYLILALLFILLILTSAVFIYERSRGAGDATPTENVVLGSTIYRDNNVFLFPLTTSSQCGANNCTWQLYSHQVGHPKPELIAHGLFGNIEQILPSPDKIHVAVLSYIHGGVCNSGAKLHLLKRETSADVRIHSLDSINLPITHVESIDWTDNQQVETVLTNYSCSEDSKAQKERCVFDLGGITNCEILE